MISVDTVYKTVLTIYNKEQRGLLTPAQFNRLGNHASLALVEKAIFDFSRATKREPSITRGDEYADLMTKAQEKLDYLTTEAAISTNVSGVGVLPTNIYKLLGIYVCDLATEVEPIRKSEVPYYTASKLASPSLTYPVYTQEGGSIQMYPKQVLSLTVDYIRVPTAPVWGYTGGGASAYQYDFASSTDFDLHPSEETDLVIKILSLAGIVIKDPFVVEVAKAEAADNFNTENAQ